MNEIELAYSTGKAVALEAVKAKLDEMSWWGSTTPGTSGWTVIQALRKHIQGLENPEAATVIETARPSIDTGNPVATTTLAPESTRCQSIEQEASAIAEQLVREAAWARAFERATEEHIEVRHIGGHRWHADSYSHPGRVYHLYVNRDGSVACSCQAGSNGRPCKHAAAVRHSLVTKRQTLVVGCRQ